MSFDKTEYSVDELNPPAWLNKEFFLKVIRHCEKQHKIELHEFKISPATAKNDHYASVMFRAVVKYMVQNQSKEKSLILKTMPEMEGDKKELFKDTHIFETEIDMYTHIIPKFEEILRTSGDNTKFGPDCLYYSLSPKKLIIFEDMIPHGYTVLRMRQTNSEESKAVYAKIAKWHAISYKLNLEQPEFFQNYHSNAFVDLQWRDMEFITDGFANFIEMLNEHADLVQYKQYFEPLKTKILDYVEASYSEFKTKPNPLAFYVLCHGDFHHKNMLFKYDERNSMDLLDVLLIDYQMCYIGPIVNDIINSIYMLIDAELRLQNLDELLYFYFSTFQETLRKIGFKGTMPKMIEFRKQLSSHRHLSIFLFTTFLPLLYAIQDKENDIGEMISKAECRKTTYKNLNYVNDVRRLLPIYLRLGYLEN